MPYGIRQALQTTRILGREDAENSFAVISSGKRKQLLEESSLTTPRSKTRAVLGVLTPYLTKSSAKERVFAVALFASAMYLSKFSVDMQAEFGDWQGILMNTVGQLTDIVRDLRPDFIANIIGNYPDLQTILQTNPQLNDMLMLYPDGSKILQNPAFRDLLIANEPLRNVLQADPTMQGLFMNFPGISEAISKNPAILEQLTQFNHQLSDMLSSQPGVTGKLKDLLYVCGGAFFQNSWNTLSTAFQTVAQQPVIQTAYDVAQGTRTALTAAANEVPQILFGKNILTPVPFEAGPVTESAKKLWYSKDMATIALKFTAAALASYKATQLLILRWRAWSTGYYTSKLMSNRAFQRIKNRFTNIDNPGQRLQEDPDKFSAGAVSLMTGGVTAIMTLSIFSQKLWDRGPIGGVEGGFFWTAFAYSAALLAITVGVARKLPEIYRNKQRVEGNLRRSTDNIANNADQIALTENEETEKEMVKRNIKPVMMNAKREIGAQMKMIAVDATVGNVSIPIPYLIVAFTAIATGNGTLGTIQSLNYAFNRVNSSMSFIVNRFEQISNLIATASRMYTLDKATDASFYLEEEKRRLSHQTSTPEPANT
ncbi:MAG: bacilysin biosynthesis protein BacA [Alphaproteobacteria bacterium]|nr:bacilysin biosynthesis protein BacA [Alphaproteobacteria bacterium]